jgi:hypothetical protein
LRGRQLAISVLAATDRLSARTKILIKLLGSKSSGATFADNGNSGSVVYTRWGFNCREPVGLLKSWTSTGYGVASPFGAVLGGLGATMAYRATRQRAAHPATALPQPGLRGRQLVHVSGWHSHAWGDQLPPLLLPDRDGHVADRIKPGDVASAAGHPRHLDSLWPPDYPNRQIQDLSHHRRRRPGRFAPPDVAPTSRYALFGSSP